MSLRRKMASKLFLGSTRPPLKLHKISPTIPPNYSNEDGSLLHKWRSCPLIQNFWKGVHCHTTLITTYQIEFAPAQMLLHHSAIPKRDYQHSLSLHLLNAAKTCIPTLWKSSKPPTIADWIRLINKVAEMEDLVDQVKDTPTQFRKITTTTVSMIHKETRYQVGGRGKGHPLLLSSTPIPPPKPTSPFLSLYTHITLQLIHLSID